MMREQKRGCKRRWVPNELSQPFKPLNYYTKLGIRPYAPGQPKPQKQIYTSEQDFIDKQTRLIMKFRRPVFVTWPSGNRTVRYKDFRPVTSDSWKIYQQQMQSFEERDTESLPCDPVDASAAGLNHPLLEEKPDLEVLSSAPLDALDATEKAATVTEPVVEGLPCDPYLDIPAAGFNISLLDAQAPEITAAPVGDLVAESLLGDKHDGGPKGKHVLEGSSSDPHGEDESLGTTAKKKAHQKMHDKKKCKSIVLSPGRLSMKKMKMGRNLDGFSQDKKLFALVKRVVKEEMKKGLETLKRKFKSYINE